MNDEMEKQILEKIEKMKGKIEYLKLNNIFSEEEIKKIGELIDQGKIELVEDKINNTFLLVLNKEKEQTTEMNEKNLVNTAIVNFFEEVSKKISFKSPLQYERFEIPEEYIEKRNLAKISYFLASNFVNLFNVKTLKKGKNVIGTFLFDGKRYIEAEEIAKKFLEDMVLFNREKFLENKIRTVSLLKDYLYHVKYMNFFEFEELPLIAFKNCVLDWGALMKKDIEKAFREHNPNILVFNYVDYDLNIEKLKEALNEIEENKEIPIEKIEEIATALCPNSLKAFKEWVENKWILLFELIGYTLYPKYTFNKAVMLIGEGANGKSTFLRLVKEILGNENTVSISLKDICENRFSASYLYKKMANIYPDLPKMAIKDTGMFKILTGEDEISADRKFRERITFKNYAKMLFSANELPYVNDMTFAFWRRWLVVKFPNQFERREGFYEQTFTEEEKRGIITVAILAFRNVLLRSKFSFEQTEADYKEVWMKSADSVYAFLSDETKEGNIVKDKNNKELTADVYTMYLSYCDNNDLDPVTKTAFSQRMQTYGFQIIKSHGKKYYKGIKIIFNKDKKEGIENFVGDI